MSSGFRFLPVAIQPAFHLSSRGNLASKRLQGRGAMSDERLYSGRFAQLTIKQNTEMVMI